MMSIHGRPPSPGCFGGRPNRQNTGARSMPSNPRENNVRRRHRERPWRRSRRWPLLAGVTALLTAATAITATTVSADSDDASPTQDSYVWEHVLIGGGGFCSGNGSHII